MRTVYHGRGADRCLVTAASAGTAIGLLLLIRGAARHKRSILRSSGFTTHLTTVGPIVRLQMGDKDARNWT